MTTFPLRLFACPTCSGSYELFLYGFQPAFGLLRCSCGEIPIVHSIPVFVKFPRQRRVLEAIKEKDTREALLLTLASFATNEEIRRAGGCLTLGRPGGGRLAQLLDAPLVTFKGALETLCTAEEHNYFFFRHCSGSFVSSLALQASVQETRSGVLDAGCGTGHLERVLCTRLPPGRIVGLDKRFHLLYLAKRFLAPEALFVCADLEQKLPFASGTFDTVLSVDSLNYVRRREAAVAELRRVATPDAVLINAWLHIKPARAVAEPPLSPAEIRRMMSARLYSSRGMVRSLIEHRAVDLSTEADDARLQESEDVVTAVSSGRPELFRRHEVPPFVSYRTVQINPLYSASEAGDRLVISRRKEDSDAVADPDLIARGALPETVELGKEDLHKLQEGITSPQLIDLIYRMVLVDLPLDYL